jgi:hypothetical protein
MGYHTSFRGKFNTSRPLTEDEIKYLKLFSETRRMQRKADVASLFDDPVREAIGLPVGDEGEYFVGASGYYGQDNDESVIDYNNSPRNQPGLWCKWAPTADGNAIEWNGTEKFYNYIEWIHYIIDHFLKRWGVVLNGTVNWYGEDRDDVGAIIIQDNVLVNAIENEAIEGEYQVVITDKSRLLN